jgi:two-component system chemotaxis response regulator CheB
MPESAIARDNPQHVVDLVEMPALLERLSRQSGEDQPMSAAEELLSEVKIAALAPDSGSPLGPATGFSCPECNGVLFELEGENRFRCRIGHAYSLQSLVTDQARSLEDALWTALRALEEQAALSKRVASRFSDYSKLHADFERRARRASEDASLIRELLGAGSGEA